MVRLYVKASLPFVWLTPLEMLFVTSDYAYCRWPACEDDGAWEYLTEQHLIALPTAFCLPISGLADIESSRKFLDGAFLYGGVRRDFPKYFPPRTCSISTELWTFIGAWVWGAVLVSRGEASEKGPLGGCALRGFGLVEEAYRVDTDWRSVCFGDEVGHHRCCGTAFVSEANCPSLLATALSLSLFWLSLSPVQACTMDPIAGNFKVQTT
ncbi:hypothetical protein EGR_07983 [Echinococcus granulosus]|uniref:Uncharacterized protein n=1 Tax=Echinococcus granulosus TaxID=6210 RepID=W6U9H0_ECHGR|nr:hypothetical protein EGR_07983 [Echinococcus granulosus]EUB57166.1 hypothetical protein EGR_07983 [Echinococcus granulosus]